MEGAEVAFHLAALIAIPYSYEAPLQYVRTNVEGTLNVLQAASRLGLRRLCTPLPPRSAGAPGACPSTRTTPCRASLPTRRARSAPTSSWLSFHRSFGVPPVTIRLFNTGPLQSERAVVPTIITQCFAGGEVRLGDLDPTRDLSFDYDMFDDLPGVTVVDRRADLVPSVQRALEDGGRDAPPADRIRRLAPFDRRANQRLIDLVDARGR